MNNTIKITGGRKDFINFLKNADSSLKIRHYKTVEEALAIPEKCRAYIFLPDYENGERTVKNLSDLYLNKLAKLKKEGQYIYCENCLVNDYNQNQIFGYEVMSKENHISDETLLICDDFADEMKDYGVILQARQMSYIPSFTIGKPILKLGRFVGSSTPAKNIEVQSRGIIFKDEDKNFYSSVLAISDFNPLFMLPNYRWAHFISLFFSRILNIDAKTLEESFKKTYAPLKTRMKKDEEVSENIRSSLQTEALKDAIRWHFDSGILKDCTGNGSCEMVMSTTLELYKNNRVDAGLYTGWLLYASGKFFKNNDWMELGKKVFDFFAENGQLKGTGVARGLYWWCYNPDSKPRHTYAIDNGRCGIALVNMYRLTGEQKYLDKITALAEALLRWFDGEFLTGEFFEFSENMDDEAFFTPDWAAGSCTPMIYGDLGAFISMVYKITSDERYKNMITKIADNLIAAYPNYTRGGHTTSSRQARFMLLLCSVQSLGEKDYSDMINHLADYLANIQLPCGGIYSEDNLTQKEGSSAENGISVSWDADRFSDQLYCVNNSLMAFSALMNLKKSNNTRNIDIKKAEEFKNKLSDYILKIQITSENQRLNGGWMRSFDMLNWEYYGMNLDIFWGPYCIMAGWTMGILPLSILEQLTGECFFQ